MASEIIDILNYVGITHDRILPFVLLTGMMFLVSDRTIQRSLVPIRKSIVAIEALLGKIKNAVIEMQTVMTQNGSQLKHYVTEGPGSPLGLTDHGTELILKSGLGDILDHQTVFLKSELAKRLPVGYTKYDVQEHARALMVELKDNPMMNPVKDYAFEAGINIDFILKAGGLWLRDDFLGYERIVHE